MTASMTGFARHTMILPGHACVWEIRSVNHRHLDLRIILPDGLRHLEPSARRNLQQRLGRGRVEAQLSLQSLESGNPEPLRFDANRVRVLVATLKEIDQMMVNGARVSAMEVLRWPGVLQQDQPGWDEVAEAAILHGLDMAIGELQAMRGREGEELERNILARLDQLEGLVAPVRGRRSSVLAEQQQRLTARVAELGFDLEPQRLAQEIAMMAQRLDVEEELDRLQGHIAAVRDTFSRSNGVVGRGLDFLMQELNREVNTLGAKSHDLEVTRAVLEMKGLIEQMREQVQNVE
jgi:uncharacterized protein (TIGR00255 family)